jgi:drug/metabolite transporter (DMT)-like permease
MICPETRDDMDGQITHGRGVVLVVLAAVLWSLMALSIRLIGEAGVWQVLFYRSVGMLPVLLIAITLRSGNPLQAVARMGLPGLVAGVGLVAAFAGAIFAIQNTNVANAVFLFSAAPLITAALGWALLGEKVQPVTWAAIGLALCGIFLMVSEGVALGAGPGNLAALISAAGFAVFTVSLRWGRSGDMVPATLIGVVLSVGVSATIILARGDSLALPPRAILIALAMGAFILGLGLTVFTVGSRVVPAAETSLLALVEVLLAPVWVWIALDETASAGIFTGGAVVLAAIVINTLGGRLARAAR